MGKLILLPNLLDMDAPVDPFLSPGVANAVRSLQGLIAESEKGGRRFLRKFLSHEEMSKKPISLLNEHTKDLKELIEPLLRKEIWGLISDAGLPCLADPGAELVALAHKHAVPVETYAGPSSLIFALQLSGFSGQKFCFHGYLSKTSAPLEKEILALEKRATTETQIFIEAPYRSEKMLSILLNTLRPTTRLCVASSLSTPKQKVISQSVAKWKESRPFLEKEPAVFLIFCG